MKEKVFEAKQVFSELNSIIADTTSKSITNEELVTLGNAFYESVLGQTGIETETFTFASFLWEIYSVRSDLQNAVKFYNKVNFDYDG